MAQRSPAAHPLHRRRALLPRPRVLADRALAGRAGAPAHVGDRPAARARDRGLADLPQRRRHRAGRGVPRASSCPRLAAWHDYLYRERTRDGEGLVELWHPVGVGHRQLAALGRGARPDRAAAGGDSRVPARRHRGRRLVAAADERRVRPLRLPRQVLPRAGLRPGADPRRVPVRDPGRPLQLDPRPGGPRTSRRSRASSARIPSRSSVLPQRHDRASTRSSGARPTACTSTTTCAPDAHVRRPHLGRARAALLRRLAGAGEPPARDRPRVRRHARRRLGRPVRVAPTIPRSTRPATGAGRSGP